MYGQIPYMILEIQSPCPLGTDTLAWKGGGKFNMLNIKFTSALIVIVTQCDGNQERYITLKLYSQGRI